jgi:UDPglucose--hexose-1-phosphate uridylyltransferase
MKKIKTTQEFRQDPFTSEWVLVSTDRNKRPRSLVSPVLQSSDISKIIDPFADIVKGKSKEKTLLTLKDDENQSQVFVVANKYPLLKPIHNPRYQNEGPYHSIIGEGTHELVIYRDMDTPIRNFSIKKLALVFEAFQKRSFDIMKQKHIRYIAVIHNNGLKSGATIAHPHSQIIASPIVPDGIERIMEGANLYYRAHKRDLAQVIIDYEKETQERFIAENEDFIAFTPYASKTAYEVEIFPKIAQAHFAYSNEKILYNLAKIYKKILKAYYTVLGDIDYNMTIVTAPVDGNLYKGFRWFIRLTPRIDFIGGYEIGTDTDICTISPEFAAELLR